METMLQCVKPFTVLGKAFMIKLNSGMFKKREIQQKAIV